MENEAGTLDLPAVVFVPALRAQERAVLRAHWLRVVGSNGEGTIAPDAATWDVEDYAPWWWIPTAPALRGLCIAAGFRVLDSETCWGGNALTLLLENPAQAA